LVLVFLQYAIIYLSGVVIVIESEAAYLGRTPEKYQFLLELDIIKILCTDTVRERELAEVNLSPENFERLMQSWNLLVYPSDDPMYGRESLKVVFQDEPIVAYLVRDPRHPDVDLVLTWVRKFKGARKEELYQSFPDKDPLNLLKIGESLIVDGSNIIRAGKRSDHDLLDHSQGCPDPGEVARLKELIAPEAKWEMDNANHAPSKLPKFLCVLDETLWDHVDSSDELTALENSYPRLITKAEYADPIVIGRAREIEISQGGVVLLTDDKRMRTEYGHDPKYKWLWEEERFIGHDNTKGDLLYTRRQDRLIADLTSAFNRVATNKGFEFY
jgi:hypothetical protein